MIRQSQIFVYMDESFLATRLVEDHLILIAKLLGCLVENNLEINCKTSIFLYSRIDYFGIMLMLLVYFPMIPI